MAEKICVKYFPQSCVSDETKSSNEALGNEALAKCRNGKFTNMNFESG